MCGIRHVRGSPSPSHATWGEKRKQSKCAYGVNIKRCPTVADTHADACQRCKTVLCSVAVQKQRAETERVGASYQQRNTKINSRQTAMITSAIISFESSALAIVNLLWVGGTRQATSRRDKPQCTPQTNTTRVQTKVVRSVRIMLWQGYN